MGQLKSSQNKNIIQKNIEKVKDTFMNKFSLKTNLTDLSEKLKLNDYQFDIQHLTPEVQVAYKNISENKTKMVLEVPSLKDEEGNGSFVADLIYAFLASDELKSKSHIANSLNQMVLFKKKLETISEEFDSSIGAQVAKMVVEEIDVRNRRSRHLEQLQVISKLDNPAMRTLSKELAVLEQKIKIDAFVQQDGKRIGNIAAQACAYLSQMGISAETVFTNPLNA
jgi:hypothetical protein